MYYYIPLGIEGGRFSNMSHTIKEKNKLLNRVRRVAGQVEALERAIEEEKGCSEILHLVVAARGAMNSLMAEIIEDHIREHVVDPDRERGSRARGAEELIEIVQSYLK
jgi:DNA-binding FrmR family transcriptional regulator